MTNTNKKIYSAPRVKVVEFLVENGFEGTLTVKSPQINDGGNVDGQIETFGRTTFEGWGD